ncbi:MAG TPA: hypothetical protein VFL42_03100, partial [Terriglobales bacterium]|nr:hypothetical protein [Terriglobales bacterium]
MKKVFSLAIFLIVISTTTACFAFGGETEAPPASEGNGRPGFAIAFKSSSLGLGFESGVSMTRFLDIRGGFDTFSFSPTFTDNGIRYNG